MKYLKYLYKFNFTWFILLAYLSFDLLISTMDTLSH